jgi:pseudoazurin
MRNNIMRSILVGVALTFATLTTAQAEIHEVKMLNRGAAGPMVYEPDFLAIRPGDTVKFLNASSGHNAVTIDGMTPEGHPGFKGNLNEEIEVALEQEGFYGIKCSPHFAMGMVMVIKVGEGALSESFMEADLPARARKRFEEILDRAGIQK